MPSGYATSPDTCEPPSASGRRLLGLLDVRFWLLRDPKPLLNRRPQKLKGTRPRPSSVSRRILRLSKGPRCSRSVTTGRRRGAGPSARRAAGPPRPHRPTSLRSAGADCNGGGGRQRAGGGDRSLGARLLGLPGREGEARRRRSIGRRCRARLRRWRRWEPLRAPCARCCASSGTRPGAPTATAPPTGTCWRPSARTGYAPPLARPGPARPGEASGRPDCPSPQVTSEKLCRAQQELHFQAATYLCLLRSVREHEALHREYHGRGERSPKEVAGLVGFRLPQQPGGKG